MKDGMINCRKELSKLLIALLVLGSIAAAVKCIFVSLQMDEEYAISMAYRLLRNDRLLTEIWDPHQTSAFLIQFLVWIYMKITGTTTYVVLFIRFIGVLIHAVVSYYLYRCLCHVTKREYSFLLAIVYFNLLPKGYVMPEFSNMMMWSLTMLLISLSRLAFLENKADTTNKKILWTSIEIGLWVCLMVLSYPSCMIIYPFVIMYLLKYSTYGKKVAGIVTWICILSAGAYILWLLTYMSVSELMTNVQSVIASCGSHGGGALVRLGKYGYDLGCLILFGGGYILASVVLHYFVRRKRTVETTKQEKTAEWMLLFLVSSFVLHILHWILMLWHYEYSYPFAYYFVVFGFAFYGIKNADENVFSVQQKQLLSLWWWGNVVMYVAILLLTNLTLFTSVKYLMPGIIICVLALITYAEKIAPEMSQRWVRKILILWCFTAIFVKGWVYTTDDGSMKNITSIGNIISVGPAKGIITEYMQGYMQESIYEELHTYVEPGDNLMVVDWHTLCYLYQDVNIASPITICTPTYDENMLDYWERNPDKYPDVVGILCWFGELQWKEGWITEWLENDYGASQVVDGKYLRYYIR